MPAKMARSAPRPPSGLPEVAVAVRIALLPCREPGKSRISKPVRESSGESRLKSLLFDALESKGWSTGFYYEIGIL